MQRLPRFGRWMGLALMLALCGPARGQGRAGAETEEDRSFSEAEKLFNAGRYGEAAPLYDKALSLNPTRPATLVKRATLYFRERRYDQAIQLLSRAEKLAPEDLNLKSILGLCLYQSGQIGQKERGLSYLTDVAARRPESYEAQFQIGQHYAHTDPRKAIAALDLYFRYRPEEQRSLDAPVQLLRGTAYFLVGRLPEAQQALEAALKERPGDMRIRLTLGAVALARGDFARAVALHEPLAGEARRRPRIAYNLGLSYLKLGRLKDAARLATEYTGLRPEDPLGQVLTGDIALAGGKEEGARAALRAYGEADGLGQSPGTSAEPLNISLDSRVARAYIQARDPVRAIAVARARLDRIAGRPDEGETPRKNPRRGGSAQGRPAGQLLRAADTRGEAKAGEEGELLAALLEAQLQLAQGDRSVSPETVTWASRLSTLYPADAGALALSGSGAFSAGELERARIFYGEALLRDSKLRRARVGLSRVLIRLATLGVPEGADGEGSDKAQAAVPLLEQALRLQDDGVGETSTAARDLVVVYLMIGRYAEADRVLGTVLSGSGRDPVLLRLRARVLLGLGQKGPALEAYERAVTETSGLLAGAAADKERQKVLVQQLGELHIELGGRLLLAGKLDEAVESLEKASRELFGSAGLPESGGADLLKAGLRNLSLAYLARGRARLAEFEAQSTPQIKTAEGALEDLSRAIDRGGLHPGKHESGTALCAAALAAVQATKYGVARDLARRAQGEGGCEFQPAFDRLGYELLTTYINYRDTGSSAQRDLALRTLAKLQGRLGGAQPGSPQLGALLRALLRSANQMLAYDYYATGKTQRAAQLLRTAQKLATRAEGEKVEDPVLVHNLAVVELAEGRPVGERVLERLGGRPVESLVNLGILHERKGEQKKALELYRRALERGAHTPKLREWIEAKERLYGETL